MTRKIIKYEFYNITDDNDIKQIQGNNSLSLQEQNINGQNKRRATGLD